MTITGTNNYQLEGTEAGHWTFNIVKGKELITDKVITALKNFDSNIYFNDLSGGHWFFDFKADKEKNIWVESLEIDCNNMIMNVSLFQ